MGVGAIELAPLIGLYRLIMQESVASVLSYETSIPEPFREDQRPSRRVVSTKSLDFLVIFHYRHIERTCSPLGSIDAEPKHLVRKEGMS